jgi:hypothetical protein
MNNIPDLMYKYAESRPPKVITRISPSMVGRCPRTHFLAIKGVPQTTPPNPGAVLNFQVGFLWEEVVKQALRGADVPFIEQYHMVDEEMNTEGTLDFAPFDPKEGTWEIWDSKTEGINAAGYRKKEGHNFFNHHPEYVHQLNTYYLSMTRQGFKVTQGKFAIIVKDNGWITEEIIQFPNKLLKETKQRIKDLNGYLRDDELPPCECEGWKVNYCSYGDIESIEKNKTGKSVPTKCCDENLFIKEDMV